MLGISRGTLRTALQRLEESGEIVRRQGSGTFVGRVTVPTQLEERLDRLEPYSSLARRRGVELSAASLEIEERPVGREVGELLELDPRTPVTTISRVLVAAGRPVSVMLDITHPTIGLPPLDRLRRDLGRGLMVNPTARPVPKAERPSLSPGGEIADDDVDVAAEQGLDFRQRYPVSKTFRQVPAIPLEAAEMHSTVNTPMHMQKQYSVKRSWRQLHREPS